MEKIKMATGMILDVDTLSRIPQPDQLYIRIVGKTVKAVAEIFSDPAHTRKIWYGDQYFAMYTKLIALIPEPGCIRVVLGR